MLCSVWEDFKWVYITYGSRTNGISAFTNINKHTHKCKFSTWRIAILGITFHLIKCFWPLKYYLFYLGKENLLYHITDLFKIQKHFYPFCIFNEQGNEHWPASSMYPVPSVRENLLFKHTLSSIATSIQNVRALTPLLWKGIFLFFKIFFQYHLEQWMRDLLLIGLQFLKCPHLEENGGGGYEREVVGLEWMRTVEFHRSWHHMYAKRPRNVNWFQNIYQRDGWLIRQNCLAVLEK